MTSLVRVSRRTVPDQTLFGTGGPALDVQGRGEDTTTKLLLKGMASRSHHQARGKGKGALLLCISFPGYAPGPRLTNSPVQWSGGSPAPHTAIPGHQNPNQVSVPKDKDSFSLRYMWRPSL